MVTASAGTIPLTNAIRDLSFDKPAGSATSTSQPATASIVDAFWQEHGLATQSPLPLTESVLSDSKYVPGSGLGIAGTIPFSVPVDSAAGTAAHAPGTSTEAAASTPAPKPHDAQAPAAPSKPTPTHAAPPNVAAAHATPAHTAPAHTAPAHTTPAKPAPVKPAPAKPAPAKPAPAHHVQAPAAPAQPYTFYDSVTPSAIPAGQEVATYADGNYAASPASVAGRSHVLWIDVNGSDPSADALDVEPGDATPAGAAQWVQAKLDANHGSVAIVYTMISDWSAVKADVGALPNWMQSHVRYWIADPTGVPHVVPGSSATQWYWGNNYDISTADPGF
jgi:hypothetical protein